MTSPRGVLRLAPLTLQGALDVLAWREKVRETLRTVHPITREAQETFYREVVCRPTAQHQYWAVVRDGATGPEMVAMVGLTGIQWEHGLAEVSLVTNPEARREGVGTEAFRLMLCEAFWTMRLRTVVGECYESNPSGVAFWRRLVNRIGGVATTLPRRKWWNGQLWGSYYFTIPDDAPGLMEFLNAAE